MLAGDGEQNSFNAIHRKFGHNGDARREPRQNAFDTIPISKARYFDTSKVRYLIVSKVHISIYRKDISKVRYFDYRKFDPNFDISKRTYRKFDISIYRQDISKIRYVDIYLLSIRYPTLRSCRAAHIVTRTAFFVKGLFGRVCALWVLYPAGTLPGCNLPAGIFYIHYHPPVPYPSKYYVKNDILDNTPGQSDSL